MLNLRSDLFKDILIEGTITSQGEYDMLDRLRRTAEGYSIVDKDGVTVHFEGLSVPKALDDKLEVGQPISMRILRFRAKKNVNTGYVYAVKPADEERWYVDSNCIKDLNQLISFGYKRIRWPGAPVFAFGVALLAFLPAWLAVFALFGFSYGIFSGVVAAVGLLVFFGCPVVL